MTSQQPTPTKLEIVHMIQDWANAKAQVIIHRAELETLKVFEEAERVAAERAYVLLGRLKLKD